MSRKIVWVFAIVAGLLSFGVCGIAYFSGWQTRTGFTASTVWTGIVLLFIGLRGSLGGYDRQIALSRNWAERLKRPKGRNVDTDRAAP
jgi:protein-S-isoprenylcysteine O-methyltransferase Ste14